MHTCACHATYNIPVYYWLYNWLIVSNSPIIINHNNYNQCYTCIDPRMYRVRSTCNKTLTIAHPNNVKYTIILY